VAHLRSPLTVFATYNFTHRTPFTETSVPCLARYADKRLDHASIVICHLTIVIGDGKSPHNDPVKLRAHEGKLGRAVRFGRWPGAESLHLLNMRGAGSSPSNTNDVKFVNMAKKRPKNFKDRLSGYFEVASIFKKALQNKTIRIRD